MRFACTGCRRRSQQPQQLRRGTRAPSSPKIVGLYRADAETSQICTRIPPKWCRHLFKPRLHTRDAEALAEVYWPEANWQSFIFGNLEKCFHTSQTAKTFSSPTNTCFGIYCSWQSTRSEPLSVRETTSSIRVVSLFFTNFFRGFWAYFRLFATAYPGTQKRFKTLSY